MLTDETSTQVECSCNQLGTIAVIQVRRPLCQCLLVCIIAILATGTHCAALVSDGGT